ncbi:hypothetical protein V6Z11_A04G103900 [Gossypium hirsutum]
MPLIIPTLTGLMSTLLKWVPIMVEVIHTSRYRLVPCLDTLIRVLAIMSVVNRRHYATPCRIQISFGSYRLGDHQQLVTLSLSIVWYCYVLDYLMACIE